ncbi:MAG: hypothetical protein ACTSPV_16655 [Candidatus Hodarchaeales archaeon]
MRSGERQLILLVHRERKSREVKKMEMSEYVEEYLAMRKMVSKEDKITGDEMATLYAIYRKDKREGGRTVPSRSNGKTSNNEGLKASEKTRNWLKDLRKKGLIQMGDEQLEKITQAEASKILDNFDKKKEGGQ